MMETVFVLLDSAIRLSVPLLLAALAGLYSERSGIFDIGLEGKMLASAFAGAAAAAVTDSALAGLAAGIAISVLMALLHGFASISARGNQIVSGVAINFLALGLTALLGQAWFSQGGQTPSLSPNARFLAIELPFAEALSGSSLPGRFYGEVISGHNALVYAAFLAVPLSAFVLYRTRFGLRLRAVGENPGAVDTAGLSVTLLRYQAVVVCGVLAGLSGLYLSMAQSAGFVPQMSAGKGFIALAALIFAKWRPLPVLGACLLFGFLDALGIRLQGVALPLVGELPVQAIQALPYILTVVLLAGFIGKAEPPKAGGTAYVKER